MLCFRAENIELWSSEDCCDSLPALVLRAPKIFQVGRLVAAWNTAVSISVQRAALNSTCRFLELKSGLSESLPCCSNAVSVEGNYFICHDITSASWLAF